MRSFKFSVIVFMPCFNMEVSVLLYNSCEEFFWYLKVLWFLKYLLKTCDVILRC